MASRACTRRTQCTSTRRSRTRAYRTRGHVPQQCGKCFFIPHHREARDLGSIFDNHLSDELCKRHAGDAAALRARTRSSRSLRRLGTRSFCRRARTVLVASPSCCTADMKTLGFRCFLNRPSFNCDLSVPPPKLQMGLPTFTRLSPTSAGVEYVPSTPLPFFILTNRVVSMVEPCSHRPTGCYWAPYNNSYHGSYRCPIVLGLSTNRVSTPDQINALRAQIQAFKHTSSLASWSRYPLC